jgi:putative transcriptional regulator
MKEVKQHRAGKITLRKYEVTTPALPEVTPAIIRETRERLKLSRAVFALELHVSLRTLEKWEQGRAKPNDQAAALILLVRKYPDALSRLKTLTAKVA